MNKNDGVSIMNDFNILEVNLKHYLELLFPLIIYNLQICRFAYNGVTSYLNT